MGYEEGTGECIHEGLMGTRGRHSLAIDHSSSSWKETRNKPKKKKKIQKSNNFGSSFREEPCVPIYRWSQLTMAQLIIFLLYNHAKVIRIE